MKPPIPYFGGKITTGPAIAALFPQHNHYVEPYCGSLAVLLAKTPSGHETVNDLDGALMTFWRVLRDQPADLARVCALTPHSRAEHTACHDLAGDDLEVARRVFVQLSQGRAGARKRTGWRHFVKTAGNAVTSMPDYLEVYVGRILDAAERLAGVSLESMPALDLIAKYGADEDVLLYVDPPYLGTTRCRSWDGYHHEMRGEAEHRDLAAALHACKAAVVLSGYASDLYDRELYAGWDRHTIAAGTGQGGVWANRTEVLWSNRPLGHQPSLLDALDHIPA
ncbi:DNA adenine methylase [Micromonospora haikouensis]|uniref:DNA adenine methylase n=1 Tax=Micromonospora haikouensis TaxID=686309 RepID=UPI003D711EFC